MNPTHIHPVIATTLGYDVDAMNDTEKVTLVRRRVVYEELVMSKEEFEQMNNTVAYDYDLDAMDLKMTDIGFPDLTDEETQYTAFPGDVTSFTDDAIAFMFDEVYWTDPYKPVKIAKP